MAKYVGLFNPLTLSGTIIVNGAVASVHSEWFLDSAFAAFGRTDLVPATYQASHRPRWIPSMIPHTCMTPESKRSSYVVPSALMMTCHTHRMYQACVCLTGHPRTSQAPV